MHQIGFKWMRLTALLFLAGLFSTAVHAQTPILGDANNDYKEIPVDLISLYPMCSPQKLDGSRQCYAAAINAQIADPRAARWQAQIVRTRPASFYRPTTLQKFPLWELNHLCGGSLIANNWIITAAHCVKGDGIDPAQIAIRLGAVDISVNDGRMFPVDRVVVHQDYDPNTQLNDIALVRFYFAGTFPRDGRSNVSIIPLHGSLAFGPRLTPLNDFKITGWGVTSPGPDGRASALLRTLDVQRVPNPLCAQALGTPEKINNTVICAISDIGDSCQGDSGGPLTASDVLIGVVSWGRGCNIRGNPGVYTRISAHLDWITRAMASPSSVREMR